MVELKSTSSLRSGIEYMSKTVHDHMVVDQNNMRPYILMLTSSLFTDRIIFFTRLLQVLSRKGRIKVWTLSDNYQRSRQTEQVGSTIVERFPEVRPFKEFPYNYPLRRFNELVWDFRLRPPSRLSMMRHIRNHTWRWPLHALKGPAHVIASMRLERLLERCLERILLTYSRSPEARERFIKDPPTVLVSTKPLFYEDPAIVAEAKKLAIPVLAFVTSWDNLSTKNRMVFRYDGFLVWSERMKEELHHFYPYTRRVPVYVVGAPQYDIFFQKRFQMSRSEFCAHYGLHPDKPIIVYALSSPNFIPGEWYGAYFLAQRLVRGELGDVQMIVRPHPLFDNGELQNRFREFGPRVVVQQTGQPGLPVNARFQDEKKIREWVNTFRHADVVINFASTVTVDAAIFDKPVVNLDFDPEPGHPHQALIKDVNHVWTHFKPVAESGGIWLVNNFDEMVEAVKTYLAHPELHREKRRWIAENVCGYVDGRCGERMAEAILDFVENFAHRHE